jgi:hypothetical protein
LVNPVLGTRLPQRRIGSASVVLGNTFALVGGIGSKYIFSIVEYDPETEDWITWDSKFTWNGRLECWLGSCNNFAVMVVDLESFPGCGQGQGWSQWSQW